MTSAKRLQTELKNLTKKTVDGISAKPNDNNLNLWEATIIGPKGSPYEGGKFKLSLKFPNEYPFKAPSITFLTKIYHPNISANGGGICLDILKDQWSPALSIQQILLSIQSLLTSPNGDSPLTDTEYNKDRKKYEETVRDWVKKYASDNISNNLDTKKSLNDGSNDDSDDD